VCRGGVRTAAKRPRAHDEALQAAARSRRLWRVEHRHQALSAAPRITSVSSHITQHEGDVLPSTPPVTTRWDVLGTAAHVQRI